MGKEKKKNLPLDDARYDPLRERIKEMLKNDPELFDTKSLREFLETYKTTSVQGHLQRSQLEQMT